MKKRILIFGGGENQLTLIEAARSLGVESVVIDPDANAPGKRIADHFEVVGPKDYNLTREVAKKYKVDGIVTGQMENPLRLMAKLAKELGFIFPSPEVIERCRNKYFMKKAFLENNIPCARGILVKKDEPIAPRVLESFKYPLIIKPVDSHSSRGVYRVESYEELLQYDNYSRSFSSDKSIIIEEFVDGPEYSVEAITYRGKTTIIQYTEKIITHYPHTVELGHLQPADLMNEQKASIEEMVIKAINALGIDNTATHTEMKLSKEGPVIIEIGARLGGDYIASYLTLASTGVDMDKSAIHIALGIKPEVIFGESAYSFIKYLELPEGKVVQKIGNWKELMVSKDLVHANLSVKESDIIPKISDSSKRPGFIIVRGQSKKEIIRKANLFCQRLRENITLN